MTTDATKVLPRKDKPPPLKMFIAGTVLEALIAAFSAPRKYVVLVIANCVLVILQESRVTHVATVTGGRLTATLFPRRETLVAIIRRFPHAVFSTVVAVDEPGGMRADEALLHIALADDESGRGTPAAELPTPAMPDGPWGEPSE